MAPSPFAGVPPSGGHGPAGPSPFAAVPPGPGGGAPSPFAAVPSAGAPSPGGPSPFAGGPPQGFGTPNAGAAHRSRPIRALGHRRPSARHHAHAGPPPSFGGPPPCRCTAYGQALRRHSPRCRRLGRHRRLRRYPYHRLASAPSRSPPSASKNVSSSTALGNTAAAHSTGFGAPPGGASPFGAPPQGPGGRSPFGAPPPRWQHLGADHRTRVVWRATAAGPLRRRPVAVRRPTATRWQHVRPDHGAVAVWRTAVARTGRAFAVRRAATTRRKHVGANHGPIGLRRPAFTVWSAGRKGRTSFAVCGTGWTRRRACATATPFASPGELPTTGVQAPIAPSGPSPFAVSTSDPGSEVINVAGPAAAAQPPAFGAPAPAGPPSPFAPRAANPQRHRRRHLADRRVVHHPFARVEFTPPGIPSAGPPSPFGPPAAVPPAGPPPPFGGPPAPFRPPGGGPPPIAGPPPIGGPRPPAGPPPFPPGAGAPGTEAPFGDLPSCKRAVDAEATPSARGTEHGSQHQKPGELRLHLAAEWPQFSEWRSLPDRSTPNKNWGRSSAARSSNSSSARVRSKPRGAGGSRARSRHRSTGRRRCRTAARPSRQRRCRLTMMSGRLHSSDHSPVLSTLSDVSGDQRVPIRARSLPHIGWGLVLLGGARLGTRRRAASGAYLCPAP